VRIAIVGQAPGRTNGSRLAFDGPSGERLARLAGFARAVDLRRAARLTNLLVRWPGRGNGKGDAFPIAEAREAAWGVRLAGIVLLAGRGVARAFGLGGARYFEWAAIGAARVAVVPHPSGISHWWNDPRNRRRAGAFLRGVFGKIGGRRKKLSFKVDTLPGTS
jgi:hypothetical protein